MHILYKIYGKFTVKCMLLGAEKLLAKPGKVGV